MTTIGITGIGGFIGRRIAERALARAGVSVLERAYALMDAKPSVRVAALDYLLRPHAYGIGRARVRIAFEPRIRLEDGMVEIARVLGLEDPSPSVRAR